VKVVNLSYWLKCTIIGHSQRRTMNLKFQPWKGQATSFGNFDSTLVILSNLHHVNSPMAKKKTYEKNLTKKN
jgi:endonuclease/exonuclease/phosphatase (EEP) superfamily protein YafD